MSSPYNHEYLPYDKNAVETVTCDNCEQTTHFIVTDAEPESPKELAVYHKEPHSVLIPTWLSKQCSKYWVCPNCGTRIRRKSVKKRRNLFLIVCIGVVILLAAAYFEYKVGFKLS